MEYLNELLINSVLEELAEMDVLAVSATEKLVEQGQLHLTVYPNSSKNQDVNDYLSSIDLVSIEGNLSQVDYDLAPYSLDFLGEIPLYVDENIGYFDPETGKQKRGYNLSRGLSALRSAFSPLLREKLEDQLPMEVSAGDRQ